eukprot:g12753.t1
MYGLNADDYVDDYTIFIPKGLGQQVVDAMVELLDQLGLPAMLEKTDFGVSLEIDARSSQKPYRSALCIGSMQNPYPHAKIARDSDKPPRKWEHAYPDFLQTVSSDAQHYCGMLVKEKHFERKNVFTF